MVLILLVGFVTPRGSLKTEDRRRFLEFKFLLKIKLTLNVYSYCEGLHVGSFEV